MPEHNVQALIMRVTPQANITDGTGTTIPVKTAAQARKVLTSTARLHGRAITVKQHGYDPGNPTAGTTLAIDTDGKVQEREDAGTGPSWDVVYHSWVIDVEHEGSYNVPGLPTALGDAQMLANRLDRSVVVHVEDIKPETSSDAHTLIEPRPPEPADVVMSGTQAIDQNRQTPDAPHEDQPDQETLEPAATDEPGSGGQGQSLESEPERDPEPEPEPESQDDSDLPVPVSGGDLLPETSGHNDLDDHTALPDAPVRRRRMVMLTVLVALVLLAGGTTVAVSTVFGSSSPEPTDKADAAEPVLWQTAAAPDETALAAHGVLVNAGRGKVEVFSLADGKTLGGGAIPEGPVRVLPGTEAVFTVITGQDGSNTGYVADAHGVKDFKGIKGTLVTRGPEPFLLTGTGKDQGALVWDGAKWKPVTAPEPGMAPVAASKAGVLWLGAKGSLTMGTTSSSLHTPEGATKISAWVWADETSVALIWDTPKGKVLAVHSITDGKITGQVPASEGEARKDGNILHAGTQAFTIDSGAPVAAHCADPVPAGGRLWCKTDNTWAADNARPLAPGQTPVPSPADVVITATDTGFTAYAGDAMNNDRNK